MSLSAHIMVPERGLDVDLEVADHETLALLGPNGSGKSTVLQVIAGLLRPPAGRVVLDGHILFDASDGQYLPVHRRNVAMLAQEALLFPRMSALENVAFAQRARGVQRAAARDRAMDWLRDLEAADLAASRPHQLSGGQAQRVALARALAAEPALLLLDEPLAALDAPVAAAIRQTLKHLLSERRAILVTHDILDAALLADRIAVMDRGRIVETGPTGQILHRPRTLFAAQLCGLNLIDGLASGQDSITTATGHTVVGVAQAPLTPASATVATFAPATVSVHRRAPEGSVRNVVSGTIDAIAPQAHLIRIHVGPLASDVTPGALRELQLDVGDRVFLAFKAAEVALYPA
jgi:molybdate transport system ATP-binding protein